jgi:hypothetical protein
MKWGDFQPYVMPYVIGCPAPIMEHQARLAAIEWCKETWCWTEAVEAADADGQTHYADFGVSPNKMDIHGIDLVMVGGQPYPYEDSKAGMIKAAQRPNEKNSYSENFDGLYVYPLLEAGTKIKVIACLTPSLNSTDVPRPIEKHVAWIAYGAIANVMDIPDQAFSNPSANVWRAKFYAEIQKEASRKARGAVRTSSRQGPKFL